MNKSINLNYKLYKLYLAISKFIHLKPHDIDGRQKYVHSFSVTLFENSTRHI